MTSASKPSFALAQFVNPRRERFHGQDVLVFDFEPNPEYKARNMVERIVHELAGVIWIDEKAHEVVRLEAYFVGDFRVAGGLVANLQKGTSFVFEQAYFNNEVWLPTYRKPTSASASSSSKVSTSTPSPATPTTNASTSRPSPPSRNRRAPMRPRQPSQRTRPARRRRTSFDSPLICTAWFPRKRADSASSPLCKSHAS